MENFRVGVLDRLGFPVSRLHELNPRPGGAVDHRLRPRRAGGEAGRLRPDRAGRGRADVDHRHRAADQGGRADRRPAGRHERRLRRAGRAARARPRPAAAASCAPRCWPAWSACTPSRAPAGRSPARCPGLAGDHHPAIAPYGLFETGTAPIQIACGSENLWRALCTALELDPADAAVRHATRCGSQHRDELVALLEAHFATDPAEHWLGAARRRRGAVGQGAHARRRLRAGSRRCRRACCSSVEHATQGDAAACPGSPIRFDDNAFSGGRPTHLAPPTLGQHDESIREWLDS